MPIRFDGNLDQLKEFLDQKGIGGIWTEDENGKHTCRLRDGIINFWASTGTVQCQGRPGSVEKLNSLFEGADEAASGFGGRARAASPGRKVFVVYGHDKEARDQLENMLRRWELEPVILEQLPSKGNTIIEKLEEYTGEVDFGVVLATPDDVGYRKGHDDQSRYRARQNVVLELGMLLIKLGRPKVAILIRNQEEMERPSDIDGLIYIPFKTDLQKEAGMLLAKEMVATGYKIDIAKL